jgi:hypothetical protein
MSQIILQRNGTLELSRMLPEQRQECRHQFAERALVRTQKQQPL